MSYIHLTHPRQEKANISMHSSGMARKRAKLPIHHKSDRDGSYYRGDDTLFQGISRRVKQWRSSLWLSELLRQIPWSRRCLSATIDDHGAHKTPTNTEAVGPSNTLSSSAVKGNRGMIIVRIGTRSIMIMGKPIAAVLRNGISRKKGAA
jgi:hypothetical protein